MKGKILEEQIKAKALEFEKHKLSMREAQRQLKSKTSEIEDHKELM